MRDVLCNAHSVGKNNGNMLMLRPAIHNNQPVILASRFCGTTKAAPELVLIDYVASRNPIPRLRLHINETYNTTTLLLARSSAPQNAVFACRPMLLSPSNCVGTIMPSSSLIRLNSPIFCARFTEGAAQATRTSVSCPTENDSFFACARRCYSSSSSAEA